MYHRKYLLPIRLFCSLGRALGSNPYTTYRFLEGDMSLSKNPHALQLYFGLVGAFLESANRSNWFHESLLPASMWLKENNPLFNRYKNLYDIAIPRPTESIPTPLPTATQITPTNSYSSNLPQLVVPNHSFPPETHNEDYRYTNLLAGIVEIDKRNFPISYNDKTLEAMLFPDLFPIGKGHYEDLINNLFTQSNTESYGKYIKLRMLCPDSRFRLYWYWPFWSYLNIEKRRNFQNTCRLLKQKNVSRQNHPTRTELITRSIYTYKPIINESITTPLSSNLRTAAPFFIKKKKQLQVYAMLQAYGLPQIFYTLTMAEDKWYHLHYILSTTDNHDTLP